MIRLHALHQRSSGTNALVVLRDTRWEDSRQIIATMEVDLSAGTQLVYTFPDMILSVNDFHNHVEVVIQTHGYDTWQGGESNLLITMVLTGRLSNTSYMRFQYSVENVVDHLITTGITAIPGERKSIEESWERWSTLGEPSGKWDYYVKYDAPPDTTPIEEIAATGWGDEFSDDEVTLGKRGENHTILHLSKEEENNDFPYPKFRNFKQVAAQIIKKHEEHVFPSTSQEESTQCYQPPHDSTMMPSVYPPAQQNPQPFYKPDYQFGYPRGKGKTFSGGYADLGLWSEVISRWESITINRLNNQTWSDNKAKLAFIENHLGESEKIMWQKWRIVFPEAYSALEAIANEPQNITS
ncbi:hypothetical protein Tco_1493438 [Tanacetum coccineum]